MDRSPKESGDSGRASSSSGTRPPNGSSPDAAGLAGMGFQFVVAILVCLLIGKWLDARLGTTPWLLILGVFFGATVSTVAMYRRAFPSNRSGKGGTTQEKR